jgi:hypothetical protein
VAAPAGERIERHAEGFVYRHEWWSTRLVGRPFGDVRGGLASIRRNIDEIRAGRPCEMETFAGKADIRGEASESPREHFLRLREKAGGFPPEGAVGLDTASIRLGMELFV